MARYVVSTDGYVGSVGAAWAFVATAPLRRETRSGALPPDVPPHLAEWRAVHEALSWAEEHLDRGDHVELHTDSALVAKGLASRRPQVSGEAGELRAACRQALARLAKEGIRVRVSRVRREENEDADALAREAAGTRA